MRDRWKVFTDYFKNAEFIFPTQQRDVYKIIKVARNTPNIKKIIIFGSSVTSACNPWSDLDVYFELNSKECLPIFGIEASLDAWTNFEVDKGLLKEILETGVIVYER